MTPGTDVWVDFDGHEWPGEIHRVDHGWIIAVIAVDPEWDFGSISPRISPHQTVAVKASRVRPRENTNG